MRGPRARVLGQRGLAWRGVRGGIALEFRAGYDAWLVASDDLRFLTTSTSEKSAPESLAVRLADEFQRVDQTRWQVLIGLRHYAVDAIAWLRCRRAMMKRDGGQVC